MTHWCFGDSNNTKFLYKWVGAKSSVWVRSGRPASKNLGPVHPYMIIDSISLELLTLPPISFFSQNLKQGRVEDPKTSLCDPQTTQTFHSTFCSESINRKKLQSTTPVYLTKIRSKTIKAYRRRILTV